MRDKYFLKMTILKSTSHKLPQERCIMQMIQEFFGKNDYGEYICQISYTYQLKGKYKV
ncbi:hypothetical protein HMPREF9545_03235 [Escherichia coli MS 16-3]|nr:hypothetical protein HMPREF9553_04313 [Escherichia coli MS 200-1]EFU56989.1 hypothetical protein HMPREF9545_03235 [Escherichia coli MS 16-3]EGB81193.1 hypothetical protein HMPREF9533_04028 [Escherichia coli MS 60-1]ESC99185.1 50S ribosomal protein L30 domain protein [Escherichia coli 907446]ESE33357.1 50S ribosomal protein L30 domain protein [Escherichia coli A35218R]